jgi:ferredoxin-NADP reductase
VDALAKALASRTETPDVYVCGPPAMVDAAAEAARDSGVSDEHIILERYLPTDRGVTALRQRERCPTPS